MPISFCHILAFLRLWKFFSNRLICPFLFATSFVFCAGDNFPFAISFALKFLPLACFSVFSFYQIFWEASIWNFWQFAGAMIPI